MAIQIARGRGAEVYVATRDRQRAPDAGRGAGRRYGSATPPLPRRWPLRRGGGVRARRASWFTAALAAVEPGGVVVLGGIHMSDIPALPYRLLYRERVLRTVANNTRADGHAFLAEAARLAVRAHSELFPLEAANQALAALKHDAIRGAGVLTFEP